MRIGIDTEKDSQDSIRKAIRFLQDLVSDTPSTMGSSLPPSQDGFVNLFAQDTSLAKPSPSPEGSSMSVFDLFKNDGPPESAERDKSDHPIQGPVKFKDSDLRAKKFDFPDDQISIIEY